MFPGSFLGRSTSEFTPEENGKVGGDKRNLADVLFPRLPARDSRQRPFPPDVANGVSSLPLSHSDSFNYKRMRKVCY